MSPERIKYREYPYARFLRVVDGDTVDFEVDLGFRIFTYERFRLFGVDAPELRGEERDRGLEAKRALVDLLLRSGPDFMLRTYKSDKYGRWLCVIYSQAGKLLAGVPPP